MFCPKCGTENENDAVFCMNCGSSIKLPVIPKNNFSEIAETKKEFSQPSQFSSPPLPTYSEPKQIGTTPGFYQVASGSSAFNVWGPFAGYGTQRNHNGWLMDNKGDRTKEIVEIIRSKFTERYIPEAGTIEKDLVAKGLIVEKRPYFLLSRKIVTVGLYVTQFGKDLYVSIASYLKPPISNMRILIASLMLIFGFYTTFIFPNALENKISGLSRGLLGGGMNTDGLASLICVIGPLGTLNLFLLSLLFLYSGYKWLSEKDFFAALRTKPNEFNEDDLMAMEKAVEQTVRTALDEIGLDPDDLKPIKSDDKRRLI